MATAPLSRPLFARACLWLTDGALLGFFMVSVGLFVGLVESPASPLYEHFPSSLVRRALVGMAMGLTLVLIVYSPLGARSGAHLNPAVTVAYWRLKKIGTLDALGYIGAQFVLGLAGCVLAGVLVGPWFTEAPVNYAPTRPRGGTGPSGLALAFAAETVMTFAMFSVALYASNTKRLARFTGFFMGGLLAAFITFESPLSGTGLNPARSLASALPSGGSEALWIYFAAPALGMLAAAELFARVQRLPPVHCCKLNHSLRERCPFCGCDGPIDFDAHRRGSRVLRGSSGA